MKLPEGYVVIYQPKYKVPSVFDLNDRGTFPERPFVTADWGFRILANDEPRVFLQVALLVHEPGKDPQTGKAYEWKVDEKRIALDKKLVPDPKDVAKQLPDADIRSALTEQFNEWVDNLDPSKKGATLNAGELKKRLGELIEEARNRIRKELVRKNEYWVLSTIPRWVQEFRYGLYNHVGDNLYETYRNIGGDDTEKNLIKKIALFNRVLENCNEEELPKPDGNRWVNQDEIWQCWVGFAGSENEAHRVCRTMHTVFKDLQV
ncbi:hypothetical protein [uncultured Desulfosarcina sp.]|uniref:hypothetical protein n=1 Tax=uncultured Desulfosarcina sp. TaxID=218289 RepID=UPI0029C8B03D|nr:hypothetical protein [uncultured Desulfosarcina sp.]